MKTAEEIYIEINKAADAILDSKGIDGHVDHRRTAIKMIQQWGMSIVDECAETADMWKSVTPGWTKGYVETVKTQIV